MYKRQGGDDDYQTITDDYRLDFSGHATAITFRELPSYSASWEVDRPVRVDYTYIPFANADLPSEIKQALQYDARVRANNIYRGQPFPLMTHERSLVKLLGPYSRRAVLY